MPLATITVKEKYPPSVGKKNWSIVDTGGVRYSVGPGDAAIMNPGFAYSVNYEDREFNGRAFKMVIQGGVAAAGGAQGGAPAKAPAGGYDDSLKQEQIFVCMAVKEVIRLSGAYDSKTMFDAGDQAQQAWNALYPQGKRRVRVAPQPGQQQQRAAPAPSGQLVDPEMNDSIEL